MSTQALLKHMSVVDVVATDVVQWPSMLEPLLQTVKALLWNSSRDKTDVYRRYCESRE
jgi:hypothetical protein